jgi:hypothetical protein
MIRNLEEIEHDSDDEKEIWERGLWIGLFGQKTRCFHPI